MIRLGIILLSHHYPQLRTRPGQLDRRLLSMLAAQGIVPSELRIHPMLDGILPEDPRECDAWIASGTMPPDVWLEADARARACRFLNAVATANLPLFALDGAERSVIQAMSALHNCTGFDERKVFSVRNPLVNLQRNDRLFRWNDATRSLVEITRLPADPNLVMRLRGLWRRAVA